MEAKTELLSNTVELERELTIAIIMEMSQTEPTTSFMQ